MHTIERRFVNHIWVRWETKDGIIKILWVDTNAEDQTKWKVEFRKDKQSKFFPPEGTTLTKALEVYNSL